ncbi:hypothetical protein FOZ61_007154 [Perkinsus olseni]|nr:hypothetical protein FOZ61_007154 [Perkinsus olseni]
MNCYYPGRQPTGDAAGFRRQILPGLRNRGHPAPESGCSYSGGSSREPQRKLSTTKSAPSLPPAYTFLAGDSAVQRASSSLLRPAASTRGSHPRSAVEGQKPVFASGKGAEEFHRLGDDDVSVVRSVTSSCAGYYPAGVSEVYPLTFVMVTTGPRSNSLAESSTPSVDLSGRCDVSDQKGALTAFRRAAVAQQEAANALRDSFKKKIRILAPLVYSSSRESERRVEAASRAAEEAKKRLEEERHARSAEKAEASKRMEAATTQYNTQRRALSAQLVKVKQENEESTKEFQKLLEERRQETLREKSRMEKQLNYARSEAARLKEELQKSTKEVEDGRRERALLQRKLSDAECRIGELQREIASLRQEEAKGSMGSQADPEVSTRITNAVALNSSNNSSLLDSIAFGESLLTDGRSSFDTSLTQTAMGSKKTTNAKAPASTAATKASAARTTRTAATARTSTRIASRTVEGVRGQARAAATKRLSPEPKKRARPRATSQRQNLAPVRPGDL